MGYDYQLFLSYARKDNAQPGDAAGQGWVAAFKAELERRHTQYAEGQLHILFAQE